MKHQVASNRLTAGGLGSKRWIAEQSTILILLVAIPLLAGCSMFPETRRRDVLHNPFPQLKRVAVLPFFNQSSEPTVDTELVAESYYAALQRIPGFEVLPVGVTKLQWNRYAMEFGEPVSGADFQRLAQFMNVEAVVVGSVTDFASYYPPRMAMTVHWYAANEGFHPIPPGYGLPWGTDEQDEIPERIVKEAEFELARQQLATQTPAGGIMTNDSPVQGIDLDGQPVEQTEFIVEGDVDGLFIGDQALPPAFPDPTGLIPDPPSPVPPALVASHEPVLSQTRLYSGDDAYFTNRLADFVETNDDARGTGWQGYLHRSDDFIRFCCYLHVTEMLESRGGSEQSDLILRWPLSRY